VLEIKEVKKTYRTKRFGKSMSVDAVTGLSMNIGKGKCLGLVGESGCGKSTLGRMISGLEKPDEGSILFNGTDIYQKSSKKAKALRREIQIVFQDSITSVDPRMDAKSIISEPLTNFFGQKGGRLDERVSELLKMVCLSDEDKAKYPFQFSGGQLQRVCIARALASEPSLIVLDEPLSSLDVSVQAQILNLLSDVKSTTGVSYLLISHDLEAVYYLSDSIYVMYSGLIMESIEDMDEFFHMKHPYSQKLLSLRGKQIAGSSDIEEVSNSDCMANGCPYYLRCPNRIEKCGNELPALRTLGKGHKIRCHNYDTVCTKAAAGSFAANTIR
jgi:nickel transport system ATP-binding protein